MKKNKNVQYVLLVLVLGIWGSIAFQMCHFLEDDTIVPTNTDHFLPILHQSELQQDSFNITLNYADPFLGQQLQRRKRRKKSFPKSTKYQRSPPPPKKKSTKVQVMPKVNYQGHAVNSRQITMVRILLNGQAYTLKKGQEEKGVTLVEMYRDSIIISWKSERKTIVRQK